MTKTRTLKAATTAIAIAISLTACDYVREREYKSERSDRLYQAAMADYTAGRIDAAIAGFEKTLRADPGNASARFQLACLLQDRRQDFLGALCNYREFLLLAPDSDKAKMAKDRCAICEKLLADGLAKKYGLATGSTSAADLDRQGREISALKAERDKAVSALQSARADAVKLAGENARLRRMMSAVGGEDDERGAARGVSAAELAAASDDDGDRLSDLQREVRAIAAEDDDDDATRSPVLDAPADRGETAADARPAASASPAPTKLTDLGKRHDKADKSGEPPHEARPATYVVQDGDTLYRIAVRFYGKMSAWTKIRDANKATVTTDGRIKAGQVLTLP